MSNTKLIDCSNIKSLNYKGLDFKTTENASWENLLDIQLEEGDQINIENAIINLKGASGDVVEITGQNDPDSKICDSKIAIKVIPYICDIGENTVALPCCGTITNMTYPANIFTDSAEYPQLAFQSTYNDGEPNQYNNLFQYFSFMKAPNSQAGNDRIMPHYNYNEPSCGENDFNFSFYKSTDNIFTTVSNAQWISPLKSNLKTYYTEKAHLGNFEYNSGLKYTIIQPNYEGPFRSDTSGSYRSGEDDFYPEYMEIKLDLGGAQYQAPSTICNMLNDQLNNTDIYGTQETQKTVGKYLDVDKLPAVTGTLLKTKFVNGMNSYKDDGKRTDYKKLWGNMAVRDLNEWTQVHYLMRLDLANNNHFNVADNDPYTTYYPSYMIPTGLMKNYESGSLNDRGYFPRTSVTMINSTLPIKDKYSDWFIDNPDSRDDTTIGTFYYSTIPKYFLLCTNVKYNEANIKRFAKAFRANETYDGVEKEGTTQDNDIDNWRNHLDLGSSQQGNNTRTWDKSEEYFSYSQGCVSLGWDDYTSDYRTGYAFSQPCKPWGDYIPNINNAYSTNRSDLPDVGTASWYHYETTTPGVFKQSIGGFGDSIITDVHYFKDNKNHDCTPAVFSRYNSNWKNLYRTDNFAYGHTNTNQPQSGFGQYKYLDQNSVDSNVDDSLSQQYNVGVYPIKMDFNSVHGEQNETVCAFLLYRDSATWNESSSSWEISTDFALPCMYQGQFLVSASFLDHPAVWLVNGQRWDDELNLLKSNVNPQNGGNDVGMSRTENINIIKIGANNPTIEFDNTIAKCAFTNLHNVKKLGLEDMAKSNDGDDNTKYDYDIQNMGNEVVKVNNTNIKYSFAWSLFQGYSSANDQITVNQDYLEDKSWGLVHSTSGIYLDSFYGEGINDNFQSTDDMIKLTEDNWNNCLLHKLGFNYTDLIVKHGKPTNLYDASKRQIDNPNNYPYLLRPLTTNPVIDIAQAGTLGVTDYTAGLSANQQTNGDSKYGALPLYNGSIGPLNQVNLDGGTSEKIYASGLPSKLESPYYLVYSDIGSPYYIQNNNELPVVGIIVKNYISGDYIYSFQTPPFNILFNRKLTSIKIEIRDNSGRIVALDKNNSIIFKLVKNTLNSIVDKGNYVSMPQITNKDK